MTGSTEAREAPGRQGAVAGAGRARRIVRNTALLTGAQLAARLGSVLYFWLVATTLGPAAFGDYQVLLSLLAVCLPIADAGLSAATQRDVARDPSLGELLPGAGLLLVALGSLVAYALLLGAARLIDLDTGLAALAGLALLPGSLVLFVSALFNARERMEATALLQVAPIGLAIALGVPALAAGWGLPGVLAAYVAAQLLTGAVALWLRRFLPRPRQLPWPEALALARRYWPAALPFGIQALLAQVYTRIDLLLLPVLAAPDAVGAYAAALRLLEPAMLVPYYLTVALAPLAATLHGRDRAALRHVFVRQSRLLLAAGLGVAAGLGLLAPEVMRLFGRDFAASGPLLRVMALSLVASYLTLPVTMVVSTTERQRPVTLLSAVGVVIAMVAYALGLLLAGAQGAAWAKVVATAAGLALFSPLVRRLLGGAPYGPWLLRPVVAMLLAFGPLWLLTGSEVLTALAGGALYLVLLPLIGALDPRDRALIRRLLTRTRASRS